MKHCLNKSTDSELVTTLKQLYAKTLRAPTDNDIVQLSQYLKSILEDLTKINIE